MKKPLLLLLCMLGVTQVNWAQCTLTNATSCKCEDSLQTNCDLLPDMVVSKYAILTYNGGPAEYSQTAPLPNRGRLTITGSTPNLGFGPLEVKGVDQNGYQWFLCGTDTISVYNPSASTSIVPNCPNGANNPHQLLIQDIYHKNGNIMTYSERKTGHMTYHPTHSHYHVDDWEIYTLRIPTSDPNPLHWPIVSQGHKVGFCLMDYGNCSSNPQHCQDSAGNYLTNANFGLQYNLDANYNCSPTIQGIGVGHLDIYWNTLDGQWIPIPPGTCNGLYAIVIVVDPDDHFLESNENNNYTWDYWTLTQQVSSNPIVEITAEKSGVLCQGDSITLTATAGTDFSWSNGAHTQNITVPSNTMDYTCTVTTYCGTVTSPPFHVTQVSSPLPIAVGDTVCNAGIDTLTATGSGNLNWYDGTNTLVGTGNTFYTPNISVPTTYYVENVTTHNDTLFAPPADYEMSVGGYSNASHYLVFDCFSPFNLQSVKVWSRSVGNRTITLEDSTGAILQTATVNIGLDMQTVPLNFNITPGVKYRLHCAAPDSLYRNNGNGVSFPYEVPGVVSIWSSDAGNVGYYYFYDWKIATTNSTCPSTKVPVVAYVKPCYPAGLDDVFGQSIHVYPNPNNGNFTLSFENSTSDNFTIQILDCVGKIVYSKDIQNFSGKYKGDIHVKDLAKGVYMLNLNHEGKTYNTKLIIK